jgi:tetratricopeptide (TPR) repeat protein
LDESTEKIRRKLGESLAFIRKFGTPIEDATTGSLEALKMFAMGDELRRQAKFTESIAFFKRAIELDPQFTLAYGRLGAAYANLSENSLGKQYLEKAFQLRERTSERERLYLAARRHRASLVAKQAVKLRQRELYLIRHLARFVSRTDVLLDPAENDLNANIHRRTPHLVRTGFTVL